ncbi:hypothetical protein GA0115255_119452 [Streptomyces sp. Ncost-T6T-2b]|nr:hypothetical protein GA0115255_119452 [Streptomyces sp. Ncost-T6T-2b]
MGLATTRALARKGAHVILAVRDEAKGRRAVAGLLLDLLTAGDDPRVVTVSSPNHRKASFFFDDISGGYTSTNLQTSAPVALVKFLFGWLCRRS